MDGWVGWVCEEGGGPDASVACHQLPAGAFGNWRWLAYFGGGICTLACVWAVADPASHAGPNSAPLLLDFPSPA